MTEIYVSTDIEADGPIPGVNSMLSFASAAFSPAGELLGTFSANLEQMPDAQTDPGTMAWWEMPEQRDAWADCRMDPRPPSAVMAEYSAWIKALHGEPVFVAYPAAYDFMFVHWYLIRFTGEDPFGHSALDIRSFAMAQLRRPYRESSKKHMPRSWIPDHPHRHVALEDAIEQGHLFCNMLSENRRHRE